MNKQIKALGLLPLLILAIGGCGKPSETAGVVTPAGDAGPPPNNITLAATTSAGKNGPVRLVRIEYVSGKTLWRLGDTAAWSEATVNMPIRQGAEVWADGGKAELQFDDGSAIRLGAGAVITLATLYADSDGEYTDIKLHSGSALCHLKDKYSIYQFDTPCETVKSTGPAELRIDVVKSCNVGVKTGNAVVSSPSGSATLAPGNYLSRTGMDDPYQVTSAPAPDDLDNFNRDRDAIYETRCEHVPENVAIVSSDIERQGDWDNDPHYGWLWSPRVEANWRPYTRGNWVWVDPVGWTWVSNEPWGWAPYHYGSWVHRRRGWAWAPGMRNQYWSPGVVDFTSYNGGYYWTPLSPEEVRYPASINIGFGGGDWFANFSIGGCATYLPVSNGYCDPYVFSVSLFSGPGYGSNWDNRWSPAWNGYRSDYRFIPRNSEFGATMVIAGQFGRSGNFGGQNADSRSVWQRGSVVMASNRAFSGPVTARPDRASFTSTNAFSSNARPAAMNRSLYSAPLNGRPMAAAGFGGRAALVPAGVAGARNSVGFVGRTGTNFRPGGVAATNASGVRPGGIRANPGGAIRPLSTASSLNHGAAIGTARRGATDARSRPNTGGRMANTSHPFPKARPNTSGHANGAQHPLTRAQSNSGGHANSSRRPPTHAQGNSGGHANSSRRPPTRAPGNSGGHANSGRRPPTHGQSNSGGHASSGQRQPNRGQGNSGGHANSSRRPPTHAQGNSGGHASGGGRKPPGGGAKQGNSNDNKRKPPEAMSSLSLASSGPSSWCTRAAAGAVTS